METLSEMNGLKASQTVLINFYFYSQKEMPSEYDRGKKQKTLMLRVGGWIIMTNTIT